jgi:hypothetical protein
VVGLSSRPGEAETPPRSRLSLSSEVEAESEPWGRARRRPSSEVEVVSEPWVGRGGVRRPASRLSPSPGSGEAELPRTPEAGLSCCQPHSIEWHNSRSDAGGAVLLSGRSVERRSDCGHFGSVDWSVR